MRKRNAMTRAPFVTGRAPGTLIVVDVQIHYHELARSIRRSVGRQVRLAMKRHWNIVFLEMSWDGDTLPELIRIVEEQNYTRFTRVQKEDYDGSKQVLEACERLGYGTERIRVCGLVANDCVKHTVQGLSEKLPHSRIMVITGSCYPSRTFFDWRSFPKLPNVHLTGPFYKADEGTACSDGSTDGIAAPANC